MNWGDHMRRDEAIALLKEITENQRFTFNWISLVNGKSGCEIHIKPEQSNPAILKPIFEKRGLELKEVDGVLVIYREHSG
jgi:hypothetical protein